MDWTEVLGRIAAGEDQHTEFKAHSHDKSNFAKAICAFANTEGGLVILGVSDSQEIVGVAEDSEKVQERLTSFLQSGCSSPVSARLGRHEDPRGWVHWLEVPRQRGFEPMRFNGRVWVRRGRSSVEPSPAELQDLYNTFGYILTEERTIEAAEITELSDERFQSYLTSLGINTDHDPQPSNIDDLRNRGAVAEVAGRPRPTLYGVLAFGHAPQSYPQTRSFYVECAAYEGDDRADRVLQVAEAKGRLDEQVKRATGWFAGLARMENYSGLRRRDQWLVPLPALREALVNSVAHRDYAITGAKVLLEVFASRVEVTSPGTLPNHMTTDSVRAGGMARSRNESMANYLLALGFMERRGRGWPVMRRAMQEFNGTEPEIDHGPESGFVRVRFHLGP
ncbi:MAG: putative DNA binding domain-containing protein [Acidimicrobiaceae bacterium]|nr:putative DNA binding domain-containing protein [Acidimicrobiaceae bacterium]